MIYGYLRVSTQNQTLQNQKLQIKKYCKEKKLHNIKWVTETVSGTIAPEKRKLGELFKVLNKGDVIICTELSRLGRSLIMIMNELDYCLNKNVCVIAIKENFTLDNSISCKALIFAFGLSAEVERQLISERTKMSLERVKLSGKHIGRRKGQKSKRYKLTGKGAYIRRERESGRSKLSLSKELNVTWETLNNFMKKNRID